MEITSNFLKNKILELYRFKRNHYLCATEVNMGAYIADVMVYNDKELIEIEVKITFSDFISDFKKRKHNLYTNGSLNHLCAYKLYYCIPQNIKEKCILYFKENNIPYGIISFNGVLTTVKKCIKFNTCFQNIEYIKRKIILRATSELVFLRNNQKCQKCGNINKPDLKGKVWC